LLTFGKIAYKVQKSVIEDELEIVLGTDNLTTDNRNYMKTKYLLRMVSSAALSSLLCTLAGAQQLPNPSLQKDSAVIAGMRAVAKTDGINLLQRDDLTVDICAP